jgi:hypothetical protein
MALKAWSMPPDAVNLLPSGGSLARLAAMEVEGGLGRRQYGQAFVLHYCSSCFATLLEPLHDSRQRNLLCLNEVPR